MYSKAVKESKTETPRSTREVASAGGAKGWDRESLQESPKAERLCFCSTRMADRQVSEGT